MTARATEADVAALVEIENACFGAGAWSETLVRAEIDAPARSVLVERDGSTVIGFASVTVAGDLADLQRVAVRPDVQGRGLGRRLVDDALRLAGDAGAERILLEVADDNAAALRIYGGAGFGEIDRRADYYGAGRDALVLARALPIR